MKIEDGRIINDFIEPNKRQYSIPVYQRNYEWSKEQCIKLFDDIVLAYEKDRTHFCGSVVRALLKEEHNIYHYVIIDGQQRLTTIYLMIKALLDCAESDKEKEAMQEALFNKDKFDTYDADTASKLKLKPIKSDNQQLLLLMDNKYDEIDKASGIWRNYELFCSLIKEQLAKGRYVKEIYKGLEKLICAKITLDSDDNAQEIFDRINSTGLPLSLADQIRNYVLMTEADQERLYEDYWLKIEKLVNKDYMTSFFLDYLNMKMEGFAKEESGYESFKALYPEDKFAKEDVLKEIYHYAKYYHVFLYGDEAYGEVVNSALQSLQKLKQTTVFLFLFRVFDDYENGEIELAELEKVMTFLLNYSIRRLICEIGSNSLRGLYKTLHSRIFSNEENKKHYYDSIVSFFMQLTSKDALPSNAAFIEALKNNNLYRKNSLCKYLLSSLENKGKEKLISDNLSIEHIMPQNKNLSTAWQTMLGENWQADRDKYLHTLGNLTLTGYNSELGDKPFAEKLELLDKADTKIVALNKDVVGLTVWNAETIQKRATRLALEIVNLFSIAEPEVKVEFNDPRYQVYSCAIPDDATNKVPNYYVLCGERVTVTNFASMLRSVIEKLYELSPSVIETMAKNNELLVSWSKNIMFSYDAEKVSGDMKIKGTEIFESTGFSAAHIMYIIQALLEKFDLEYDDFEYSARPNVQQ